ncbi:MAG: hypothetical protein OEV40_16670, partial [Acidimicrobiia bacterium]|nr:hypothetical protein [Acidimicrobiia bacterium]
PEQPWCQPLRSKGLVAMAAAIALGVALCSYDTLGGGSEPQSTSGGSPDAEADLSAPSSEAAEAPVIEGADQSGAGPRPTLGQGDGAAESTVPTGEPEWLPLPEDYEPGLGFTGANGSYYSTYGAPPEALPWMQSPTLLFNQPLPGSTPTVENNAELAVRIDEVVRGRRLYDYGSGFEEGANAPYMLIVDSDVETFTEVVFAPQACGADSWWAWTADDFEPYVNGAYQDQGRWGIPLPPDFAMSGDDSDFHVMVYDWRADVMIELWKAMPTNLTGRPGIEACWGGVTKDFSRSSKGIYPFPVGVDAAGFSAAGLTITLEDVRRGEIRHAIGVSSEMVIDNRDAASFSYPANRNDGRCAAEPANDDARRVTAAMGGVEFCLYEGQYLRLPSDYDVDAIEHPYARMIARAGRDYGFVVHDIAGCFCLQAESGRAVTVNGLAAVDPWEEVYGGAAEWEILWQIDWTQLEILPRDWSRPAGHRIPCAVPPGRGVDSFPMQGDPRCQVPGDPYGPG